MDTAETSAPLLEVDDLRTYFFTDRGVLRSVDGVSLSVGVGQTVGVVGESGCGKSVTALSIMALVPRPPGRVVGGRILFGGRDLLGLGERAMRRLRGNAISMIFQEPMTSLNPVYTVGDQIIEAVMLHQHREVDEAWDVAVEMLGRVGIPSPERRAREYPHQMSGGMKQRVMIAMALASKPDLLIADEPTTALDVTIQAQILELLRQLQGELGMSILLITHDLAVVAETCDRVVVMYAGQVVEQADVGSLFETPRHPYTRGLLRSMPSLTGDRSVRLDTIPGMVPSPLLFPTGCRFRSRCKFATEECTVRPDLDELGPNHHVACHYTEEIVDGTKAATGPFAGGQTVETRTALVERFVAAENDRGH